MSDDADLKRQTDGQKLEAVYRAIYGDPQNNVPGINARLAAVEKFVEYMKNIRLMFYGALVMMGLTTGASLWSANAILQALAKLTALP